MRVLDLPYLEDAKELEAAVRFQAQDQLPMPLEHAVLDYQPLDVVDRRDRPPPARPARRRPPRDGRARPRRPARRRPASPRASTSPPSRWSARCTAPGPSDEHVLYLAIGGLTNLAVARGTDCIFTRAVGGGLEALAIELAERSALTLEHARGWLAHVGLRGARRGRSSGDAEIVEDARQVLLDGVRRIAAEVRNSLDFHRMQDDAAARRRAPC